MADNIDKFWKNAFNTDSTKVPKSTVQSSNKQLDSAKKGLILPSEIRTMKKGK